MRCLHRECLYDTDGEISEDSTVTEKLQLLQLHVGPCDPTARATCVNLWQQQGRRSSHDLG